MATEIIQIDPQDLTTQIYESQDTNLIPSFDINTTLTEESYIEFFIYDLNNNLISSQNNFTSYSVLNDGQSSQTNELNQINIDPEQNLRDFGFDQGSYITYYNFLNKKIGSDIEPLYISEISSDRTEIRLNSTVLSSQDIVEKTNKFIGERENSEFFFDFYLNLGENILFIANNIKLDVEDPLSPSILIKLYEPLPEEITINNTLWVVSTLEEPLAYQITFPEEEIIINDTTLIQGPNFNIQLKDQINNSTQELSYSDLSFTSLQSSFNQINSLLEEKEIDINIDYTNFDDFIHFSSAKTRLENFFYKVELIENYSSSIALIDSQITGSTSSSFAVSESKTVLENKISDIIKNFDGYDYYLYYTSGSTSYPKTTQIPPYQLAPTTDPSVTTWLSNIIESASIYDENNKDNLLFSIPEYLREDEDNKPYELFIDMVAQHFDNIWIYYKDVTQKYNSDNRLEAGISKDLVADAIRDFGVKLYQNNFSNQDLYTAFLGLTPNGSLFPFPNITGSLPTPNGFEYIDTLISASSDYIPLDDVNKSLYKRIYHNLPYLLKSKGTLPGLRALITSYGIPDTILRINEFGGKDKINENDWDHWQNEFNYAYHNTGSNTLSTNWVLNSLWSASNNVPSTLEFRFKTPSLTSISGSSPVSLWQTNTNSRIRLRYTGSGFTSGSYSGSIIDPYYQYTHLDFLPDFTGNPTLSASIYLPFLNDQWWSVMATRDGNDFKLYAGNNIYEGGDNGTELGFYLTSSINVSSTAWTTATASNFLPQGNEMYLQEVRYYNTVLSERVFKDYIMNPSSIEGNSPNSSPNELAFRLPLGGELYTGSLSIHPKITGSWSITSSFITNSSSSFTSTPKFISNTEYSFYDQPIAGIKNIVNDKIKLKNNTLPSGSTLSPFRRLEQNIDDKYTLDVNYLEVAFSPQNEINEDIMNQLGFFNIGDYIGDPSERFTGTSYPKLDKLREEYFEKYISNYNLFDYIRLIKFFDNSLFKMIKDFIPARTSLASGIVIKQHLLERNKYPQPQMSQEDVTYSGSIEIGEINGGTAGLFEIFNGIDTSPYGLNGTGPENIFGITQSWIETTPSLLGTVSTVHDSQDEFYDGEFSGSVILVTTQSLNQPYPLEFIETNYSPVLYRNGLYELTGGAGVSSTLSEDQFLSSRTTPSPGEILLLAPRIPPFTTPPTPVFPFIKIHKQDCNGNNNEFVLDQVTNLRIQYPSSVNFINYNVIARTEYPTYYLYQLEQNSIDSLGTGIYTEVKNYFFSASYSGSLNIPILGPPFDIDSINEDNFLAALYTSFNGSINQTIVRPTTGSYPNNIDGWLPPSSSIIGNSLNYFNTSSGFIQYENTPNIRINLSASVNITQQTTPFIFTFISSIRGWISGSSIEQSSIDETGSYFISASLTPLQGEKIAPVIWKNSSGASNLLWNAASFSSTQSISPTASLCVPVAPEPYITEPNFYNSDQNALLNDVSENRKSNFHQDIDYNSGQLTPTNFDLLISGSAQRAQVQDSNYTTARHIIPRYEGSKSTSQYLNKWTDGDSGTFGKLPTVESLKNYIAYCDVIGGWTPEKMNASGAIIKYLIKDDGTIIIPNTSENSLNINKGTFESGERIIIESQGFSSGGASPFRNIIRGGTRIETIFYNQIGHTPAQFTNSIELTDFGQFGGVTSNYQGRVGISASYATPTAFEEVKFHQIISTGSNTGFIVTSPTRRFQISNSMISEGVALTLKANIFVRNNSPSIQSSAWARIKDSTGQVIGETRGIEAPGAGYGLINPQTTGEIKWTQTLTSDQLVNNRQYFIEIISGHNFNSILTSSRFKVEQSPIPTSNITASNLFSTSSTEPTWLFTTSSDFISFYGNENVFQKDISGSGFFPIKNPLLFERGDEIRFEGDENKVYIISEASIQSPVFPFFPQWLKIVLDRPITGSVNVNEFLFRRYVNDAGAILFEGERPQGSQPPFIIRPEFSSPGLNKSIDQIILELTEKGLI
jgi:hypothetical protein